MMSSLTPISREEMSQMKAQADEKLRQQMIQTIVTRVYSEAINKAKSSTETSYKLQISQLPHIIPHIKDIIENLKQLFPGSSVLQTTLVRGADGKYYDISTLDEKLLPFVNKQNGEMHIVVDWS